MAEQKNKAPIDSVMETSAMDPVARVDPHPILKDIQSKCPVYHDDGGNIWLLSKYEDVRGIVNDRSLWRHPRNAEEGSFMRLFAASDDKPEEQAAERPSILFMDDPDHSRVRPPIAKALYARINKKKAEIEQLVDSVIDKAPASGTFNIIDEICVPIPILVIARLIGVEESRVGEFREWSEASILSLAAIRTPEQEERMTWGSENLSAYFHELIAQRRENPQDDLISDLTIAQKDGLNLTDDEIEVNLIGLLIGGNLTTSDLIGNGTWLFLTHPDQKTALMDDPSLAAAAVEEVLRYEAPVGITTRVMSEEREIRGCPIKPHQGMMMSLHAANRDPDVFENPDVFDITRKHTSHVAFGGGSHICIGAPLARLEAQQAFVKIFEKYPNLRLADKPIKWRDLPFFRGQEELWVDA